MHSQASQSDQFAHHSQLEIAGLKGNLFRQIKTAKARFDNAVNSFLDFCHQGTIERAGVSLLRC
jgi:hypothetical protein